MLCSAAHRLCEARLFPCDTVIRVAFAVLDPARLRYCSATPLLCGAIPLPRADLPCNAFALLRTSGPYVTRTCQADAVRYFAIAKQCDAGHSRSGT